MAKNAIAADELRLLIERAERIEEEIRDRRDDLKAVYDEAKSRGFCAKTMKRIVRERRKTQEQRREEEAMFDLYRGALGMLDGTPLGNWAVDRLTRKNPAAAPKPETDKSQPPARPDNSEADAEPPQPEPTIEDARKMGQEAARAGKPVTANPFPPRDRRGAAWDEAWCHELGSDGMDIPDALRPAPRKKDDETPTQPEATADKPKRGRKPQ